MIKSYDEHLDELVAALTEAGCAIRGKAVKCAFHGDRNASGSIYDGADGRPRFKCHGCDARGDAADIRALHTGRPATEFLNKDRPATRQPKAPAKTDRTWSSLDALANDLRAIAVYRYPEGFAVLRQEGKIFPQCHRRADGLWICKKPAGLLPLYRRDEIAQAAQIVIVEGEKDADALTASGIAATTCSGGAGKASLTDLSPLRNKHIIVWGDADAKGREHVEDLEPRLLALGCTVLTVRDADRQGCKDAAELIERHGADAAKSVIAQADVVAVEQRELPAKPQAKAMWQGGDDDVAPDSEASIAAAIAKGETLANLLRFDAAAKGWREWTGTHWALAPAPIPAALVDAVRAVVAQRFAADIIEPGAASRLMSASGLRGIAAIYQGFACARMPRDVDQPYMLNLPSGVMDLRTGETREAKPSDFTTRVAGVDPGAPTELWAMVENHLRDVLGEQYEAVHRFLGFSLVGVPADRSLLWLCGPGGDGKSTLAKIIRAALGDYCAIVHFSVFSQGNSSSSHEFEIGHSMNGARLAIALEMPAKQNWEKIKGISGGDEQVAKRAFGRAEQVRRPPCLFFGSQVEPDPSDDAGADRVILGRLRPPAESAPEIKQAIDAGGDQLLALAGACMAWLTRGCAAHLAAGPGRRVPFRRAPSGLESAWDRAEIGGELPTGRASLREWRTALAVAVGDASDNVLSAFLQGKCKNGLSAGKRWYALAGGPGGPGPRPPHARMSTLGGGPPAPPVSIPTRTEDLGGGVPP